MDDSTLFSLAGTNQLVLGASKGLGLQIFNSLNSCGSNVLGIGRSKHALETSFSNNYVSCDLSDGTKLLQSIKTHFQNSKIDGVTIPAGVSLPFDSEMNEGMRFRKTIEANLSNIYESLLNIKPLLSSKSSIVLLSSINANLAFPNNPGYVASKSGLSGLTRALALDWGPEGIRVNSLNLGYFHTDMTNESYLDPVKRNDRSLKTILNRWGEISEVSGPVHFLLSSASSYITGHALSVDGGWSVKGL
jgi:NAD(P)-dependent dehydrogenase (short-subunit alcohol dehydrogenase family)